MFVTPPNSLADYMNDQALGLNSFRRQLKTFLFARYWEQRVQQIRNIILLRYINLLSTYFL